MIQSPLYREIVEEAERQGATGEEKGRNWCRFSFPGPGQAVTLACSWPDTTHVRTNTTPESADSGRPTWKKSARSE